MGETERIPGELPDKIDPRVALRQYEDGREYVLVWCRILIPTVHAVSVSFEWIVSRDFGQNWQ
jgi:hypothetical protein